MNNSSQIIQLLCVGDLILDLFLHIENESQFAKFDKESNMLSFLSGSKILADKITYLSGGNANNIAVGTKRLGINCGIAAETGTDEFADILIKRLDKEGINRSLLLENPASSATFSLNLFYINERIIFIHHVKREHNLDFSSVIPQNIFLTSLGDNWTDLYKKVVDLKLKTGSKLFFNPGSRQLECGLQTFKNVLELSDIIFINREEACEIVYGKVNDSSTNLLLEEVQKLGAKCVCITDGKNGGYFIDERKNIYHQVAINGNIINKTGAGDAFTSGFLAAYLKGLGIEKSLQWGAKNSIAVMEKVGAQTGLLKLEEMDSETNLE